jgi:glycosyltransferase involved in cell wall biosynthesis
MKKNQKIQSEPISVLMTVFNGEFYLKAALDSLINQTYKNWELILVDNGSHDQSIAVISNYHDKRIHLYRLKKNIGRTAALCFAFNKAKNEFIAILDADDVARKDRFFDQMNYIKKNTDVALIASWTQYIDEKNRVIGSHQPPFIKQNLIDSFGWTNSIDHSSVLYRKSIAVQCGGYPKDFVWAQDSALFLKIASQYKIAIIKKPLTQIRIQGQSLTRSKEYAKIIAEERVRLYEFAKRAFAFSFVGKMLNKGAIAFSKLRLHLIDQSNSVITRMLEAIQLIFMNFITIAIFLFYKLIFK